MTRAVLFDAPGPPGPAGTPGLPGRPGKDGATSQTGALSGNASPGQALVTSGSNLVSATTGAVSGVLTHAGLAISSVNNVVTYQTSGPFPYAVKNLGAGVACAVGTDASGNPVRVTDPTCVSGLKFLGVCDANGAIYVNPRLANTCNILDFGAVGDATGSAGVGTDNAAAIQAADTMAATYGGEVFIPLGMFRTASEVTQSHNVTWRGTGNKSIIVGDHNGIVCAHVGPINGSTAGNGRFEKFAIQGTTQNIGSITNATNASPIVCTKTGHGLATGAFVNLLGVMGNTAANGPWQITRVDADTFQLNGSTGNGAYTSGGSLQQVPRCGIYEFACSYDVHAQITISNCFIGRVWDQSEICSSYDFNGEGNLLAHDFLANGADFTPTSDSGFTNVLTFINSQYNGGLWGLVDDGGQQHKFVGGNFNGQVLGAARLATVDFSAFESFDVESTTILLADTSWLSGTSLGQGTGVEFKHCSFNSNNVKFEIASWGTLLFTQCQFGGTCAAHIHDAANAYKITTVDCAVTTSPLIDTYYPTTGSIGAFGGVEAAKQLAGTAAPTSGIFAVGDIVWNTAPSHLGNIGWVCTAGGVPGTWYAFGAIL